MKIETSPTMRIETQTSQMSEGISAQHDLDSSPDDDEHLIHVKCMLPEPPSRNL